jgi:hypothetical protein
MTSTRNDDAARRTGTVIRRDTGLLGPGQLPGPRSVLVEVSWRFGAPEEPTTHPRAGSPAPTQENIA